MNTKTDYSANIERFTGLAEGYDRYRPGPPSVLANMLTQFTGVSCPALVVDLGSGTGLSARYWASKAQRVVGIEPTPEMRREAEARTSETNISYRAGFSHDTGLPDRCAQIINCSQALHWMEPEATFKEAARLLVPRGVFAAVDYDWPPTVGAWEAEAAYEVCAAKARKIEQELGLSNSLKLWDKGQHLSRMKASGRFCHTKEVMLHHVETGDAERFVGVLLSQGYVTSVLKRGCSQAELGIDVLRAVAWRTLGMDPQPWYWTARVRLGFV